jgi:hypothetical protein
MRNKRAHEVDISIHELGLTLSLIWFTKETKQFPLAYSDLSELIFLINKTALTARSSLKDKNNGN